MPVLCYCKGIERRGGIEPRFYDSYMKFSEGRFGILPYQQRRVALEERADKNKKLLAQEGLAIGIICPAGRQVEYALTGSLPRTECVFDEARLRAIGKAGTIKGFPIPTRVYQCPRCETFYDLPLGEKERKRYFEVHVKKDKK